jgi:hypothetical protein
MVVLVKKKMNNFDNLHHTNIGKILDKTLVTTLIAKLYTPNVGEYFETQFYLTFVHLNALQENFSTQN